MSFLKKPIFIAAAIIFIIIVGYLYFKGGKKTGPEFSAAEKGDISEVVSVTGRVEAVKSVDLAFEKIGKINAVKADVGNYVNAGDLLVSLDTSELESQLAKANADLETQKADLDKARIDLNNDYSKVVNILNDGYTKADDAVRNQPDAMFINAETDNPQLTFTSNDGQAATDARNGRLASRTNLLNWKSEIDNLDSTSQPALYDSLSKSQDHLSVFRNFLIRLMDTLNRANSLTVATIGTYKTSIITARGEIDTAASNITNQIQAINAQKAVVASDEASIESYKANIQNIKAQIGEMFLYAPISGIVSRQDAKTGEIAAANTDLVSIISAGQFKIESDVPETDIAKIKVGSSANITLDAYGGGVVFKATVAKIDPAAVIIEGVSTYKTTLYFTEADGRVKPGLTGNVDILSAKHSDAIIIPARLVAAQSDGKYVLVLKNGGQTEKVKIQTGLRDQNGNVEIVSGLKEGDKVVPLPNE